MNVKDECPLLPNLPDAGKKEAQALIDTFKVKLKKAADEAISDLYCNVAAFIESDSWQNFRNEITDGLKGYGKLRADYDFKAIRKAIFNEYRDEIIEDLNQDMVEEINELKKALHFERKFSRQRY